MDCGFIDEFGRPKDFCEGCVIALFVAQVIVDVGFHAERETGFGDVFDVVVVDCCGYDVCCDKQGLLSLFFIRL